MGEGSDERDEKAGSAGLDREGLLAENRARRAQLREDEEAKAARKNGTGVGVDGEQHDADSAVGDSAAIDGAGATEPAGGIEPAGARPADTRAASSKTLVRVLAASTIILAIAAIVLGVLFTLSASKSDDSASQEAVNTAKDYATTVLTYQSGNYSDLDRRIRGISTPQFADQYIKSSQAARTGNDAAQATGTAKALEAGVISMSDDTAEVLVAVDQNVKSPLVPALAKDGIDYQSRVKITLTRDGDEWKLSNLEVV
ncbi:MAG: hypothetical protein WBG47_11835 [Gordonia sp. (in: high G+C Gram-positive bacteria)]|uniref:hypothetical protein n=1 Tax=Gordonia sp. (in: high G+C Gram-positive bacteria) TaxID=84139 RepID=UPI003C75C4D7